MKWRKWLLWQAYRVTNFWCAWLESYRHPVRWLDDWLYDRTVAKETAEERTARFMRDLHKWLKEGEK